MGHFLLRIYIPAPTLFTAPMWMAVRSLAVCILLLTQAGMIAAAPRVALVIGNGGYEGAAPLANPVNDASDIAAKLRVSPHMKQA